MAVAPPPSTLFNQRVERLEKFIDERLRESQTIKSGLAGNVEIVLPEEVDPDVADELRRRYVEAGWARVLVGARGGWHIRLEALP